MLWQIVDHLKDVSSILTPFLIFIFGVVINNTIQAQNRVVERESSLVKQWADNVLKLANDADRFATRVLLLYFKGARLDEYLHKSKHEEYTEQMAAECREIALKLEEIGLTLELYSRLASHSGPKLKEAFDGMQDQCRLWFRNKGGNVETFRKAQIQFNECANVMLLELIRRNR
jgi:hypothetical protein